jgi:hypothetical protein
VLPTFVPTDAISAFAISFEWSDWDPYAILGNPSSGRVEELGSLSDRALVAYSTACAEWTVYRFASLSDDRIPHLFLEALWVAELDNQFMPPPESIESEWKGNIRGPIDLALMTVLNAIGSTDGGKPEVDAALAERIALHVMPNQDLFKKWQARCMRVLFDSFNRKMDTGGSLGLPPQVFSIEFQLDKIESYKQEFLSSVDYSSNKFLR